VGPWGSWALVPCTCCTSGSYAPAITRWDDCAPSWLSTSHRHDVSAFCQSSALTWFEASWSMVCVTVFYMRTLQSMTYSLSTMHRCLRSSTPSFHFINIASIPDRYNSGWTLSAKLCVEMPCRRLERNFRHTLYLVDHLTWIDQLKSMQCDFHSFIHSFIHSGYF